MIKVNIDNELYYSYSNSHNLKNQSRNFDNLFKNYPFLNFNIDNVYLCGNIIQRYSKADDIELFINDESLTLIKFLKKLSNCKLSEYKKSENYVSELIDDIPESYKINIDEKIFKEFYPFLTIDNNCVRFNCDGTNLHIYLIKLSIYKIIDNLLTNNLCKFYYKFDNIKCYLSPNYSYKYFFIITKKTSNFEKLIKKYQDLGELVLIPDYIFFNNGLHVKDKIKNEKMTKLFHEMKEYLKIKSLKKRIYRSLKMMFEKKCEEKTNDFELLN